MEIKVVYKTDEVFFFNINIGHFFLFLLFFLLIGKCNNPNAAFAG